MRFEAGSRNFFFRSVAGGGRFGLRILRRIQRALAQLEKMQHAKVFQEIRYASVGIAQFNRAIVVRRLGWIQLQSKASQNAEEGAVHEHAFEKFENEIRVAPSS